MPNYLHGVETIEIDRGPRSVSLVKTAVIGLIGTAAAGAVNTPILISNERDFAQFGENIPGSTIIDALDAIFDQKGTTCVVINVLNPSVHKSSVTDEVVTIAADGTFKLSKAAVANVSVKNTATPAVAYPVSDYSIDLAKGMITRSATSSIPAAPSTQIKVSYDYADASKVLPSDVIGTINASGQRLGLKAFKDSYSLFGFVPKILLSPVFASLNSVASELIVAAQQLRAITFLDAPLGTTVQGALSGRGPAGTITFNTSSERAVLCYPYVKVYDVTTSNTALQPLSARAAGALSRKDQENGYWWSLSNTEILGIIGMERPIDAMINDPNCEANLLNASGITTIFNSFGTGMRTWGNRSAAWPSSTSPKNFVNVRRVADIIAESLEYFTLQYIDRPLDNALIDDIVESGNRFMRKLKADGAVIDGKVWYDSAFNPSSELAAGHLTVSYDFMPPTPAERITYQATINIDYLNQLGKRA